MPPNSLESQDLPALPFLQSTLGTGLLEQTALLSDATLEEQYVFQSD